MRTIRRNRAVLAAALAGATLGALLLAAHSPAINAIKGNLIVAFNGTITPSKLPRDKAAPVGVQMGGKIKTTDRTVPPKLQRIILDINRNGRLQTKGLPTCSLGQLRNATNQAARQVCGDALIGSGSVTSRVAFPAQGPFASNGELLAFNGRRKGRQAIFAKVRSDQPLLVDFLIVFEVKKKGGTFGTSLVGKIPPIASGYGRISAFNLLLRRQYSFHGKRLSYASAACPAPEGFTAANFAFAKVSYQFEDGRNLSSKLVRQCKVRK
jgi:hypothetical protein